MSTLNDTIQKLITKQTQETVAAIQQQIAALLGGIATGGAKAEAAPAAKAPKGTKAPKAAKAAKAAGKHKGRAANPATLQRALDAAKFIALNPGSKAGPIAKHLGIEVGALLGPMTQALKHGWTTKTGERSATLYYPGTVPTELPAAEPEAAPEAATAPAASGNAGAAVAAPSFSSYQSPPSAGA